MSYKLTVKACYIGTICQAIITNLTALLFIPLAEQFGLSFRQLGALVMVNFAVQVSISLIFGTIVDKFGFRRFIVAGHALAVIGMAWFASANILPIPPYITLMTGTVVFAIAAGFQELLLSPILNSIPTDEKSSAMSIMHAFYCFGFLAVALITTLLLAILGREAWPIITLFWLLVPLLNVILFAICPMAKPLPAERQSSAVKVFTQPLFIVLVILIFFAGSSEITFAQWMSAYLEEVIGLPKVVGDIAGVSMFAAMMGICRIGYGILKRKDAKWLPSQARLMQIGGVFALASYFIMAATSNPILALLACALCGLGVGLLWPGALSLAVDAFPKAGTWMFAILAAGGSIGGAAGPYIFGAIADNAGLRTGFMLTAAFPVGAVLCLWAYHRFRKNANT
ncbi:MAG: MFS transporter [Firmicutes bacterium]|nr:MFS transporter [Bacillota bacterium]